MLCYVMAATRRGQPQYYDHAEAPEQTSTGVPDAASAAHPVSNPTITYIVN